MRELEKHFTGTVKIGLESTGNYAKGLYHYLKERYNVEYVDSVQIYNFSRMHSYHVKNDRIDAKLIAYYMLHGFKTSNPIRTDELKDIARLYCRIIKNRSRYKCMFESQLTVIFPELEEKVNLHKTNGVFQMLLTYPSPAMIAQANPEALRAAMIKSNKNKSVFTEEYVASLQDLAKNSLGIKDYPTQCFTYTIQLIMYYDQLAKELKAKMQGLVEQTSYATLMEQLGYNVISVAQIVGEVGDIRRFPNHKHFVGYCGLDVR